MKRTFLFFIIAFTLLALAIMPSARTDVHPTLSPTLKTVAPISFEAAPFTAPTVTLTNPFNNAQFIAGSTIRLSASASDSDGTISKVEFYQGAVKLGTVTSAPYNYDWLNVPAGNYVLTAVATDNQSEVTTSSAINIAVLAQGKQYVGWSSITNGIDLGNGSVRKTSTGAWDFSASSLQTLLPGDGYFESTAANFNQAITLGGSDGSSRTLVIGSGGWMNIVENGQEVANTSPLQNITPHVSGDRYRIEITNSILRYIRYRSGSREVMFTSSGVLPAYPIYAVLSASPQNAEWQKTVLAQLTRKATWSSIVNGIDLGNGTVRKTSTGTWDFSATAAQTLVRGDGYFESTASYWNHWIGVTGSDGAGRSLTVGTGGWAAISENGQEVANTSPLGNITPHAVGDRYRLEINNGTLRYVRFRAGIRAVVFTSTNPVPAYPLSFGLAASFQNSEWQNTVFAQASQNVTWSNITNGIDLGNGSVRKTSTGTWDFSASARQQLVFGSGYFESTASNWNQSINAGGVDGAGRVLVAGTGGWAAINENGQEVANTSPIGNLSAHMTGDRYRLEMNRGKLRYVRYRNNVRTIAFTSTNVIPAHPLGFSVGASFQNSEWQNTVFSDNVPEHNDASFVSQTVPANMVPGQNYSVSVTMRNTGASVWTPDGDYQLGSENLPDNLRWGLSRVNLTTIVAPGADATFNFTVTAPAAGSHSFQWRMVQQDVQRFGPLTTNVNVQTVNNAPTVSLTSPAHNATFTAPATVPFSATAADSDGTITKVEFFQGSVKVGEDTTAPYSFNWTNVPAAVYVLSARATDSGGATATSSTVNITVNPPNQLPTVSLTAPTNGQVFSAPANIALTASASDADGMVSKVQFFQGSTLLNEDVSAPFSFNWNNVAAGNYSLTAKAFDNSAATTTSAAVAITVNALPTVSLTAPTSGQVFAAPANITLTATASDADGTVSKVQFFQGTTLLNEDLSAPYSFNWNNVAAGNYSLTAKVFDNSGATTTSAAVAITVNALPTVSLTAPTNGQIFSAPANITLTASAADANGTISKVQFFQGTTLLNEDLSAPYSFNWNNVAAANYSLTAKAFDNHGATTTSAAVSITVNILPTVSITSPTHPTTFTAPANFTINASASDADGSITKVEFFAGVGLLGEDTTAPYSLPMNNMSQGVYSLTAKATDNRGATVTSSLVTVVVNTLPTVSITSPVHPTTLVAPANFTISASATDPDGSINKVEFFAGVGLLGEDTTAPYTLAMNNMTNGVYVLTAKATDSVGGTRTSTAVSVVVTNPPTTSITSPSNNASFIAGSNIVISALAADSDGVAKVEFFKNGVLLAEDTTSPYSFAWNAVPVGTYSLTTRATDVLGVTGTSTAVNVEVVVTSLLARLDPKNGTGGGVENPLSRNYNWSVPLIGLPGRAGLDLGLSLSYNSLVWTKTGNYITFDDDAGFPSPGFRLGFPVIQGQFFNSEASKNVFLLIMTDGSRIELRQVGTSTLYESVDSSHLLWDSATMVLRNTNGMQFSYVWYGTNFQCVEIKDRNGNLITINRDGAGRITTIVDTLGRTITFNYNPTDNTLTTITQSWGGTPHVWASFDYADSEVQTGFVNVTKLGPANGTTVKTLRTVWLNDNSRFEFEHTYWIQVWKINHYAADGHLLNYRAYNLPGNSLTELDDCPRFTERHDWAENFNRGGSPGASGLPSGPEEEVLSGTWSLPDSASWTLPDDTTNETGVVVQMTRADGAYEKIYFAGTAGTPTGWKRGLPSMVETYGKTTPDQPTAIKQRSAVSTWTQDDETAPFLLNPRVKETHVYDFDGSGQIKNHQRTRTTFLSINLGDGTSCHLPQDLYEYQANATTVLRHTHTDYHPLTSEYISRRVIGLPSESRMFEVDPNNGAETLMRRVAFAFDESGSIQGTDAPIQHDNTNYSASFVTGRGNLSSVRRFNVVTGQSTVATAKYNTAGSPRKTIDPLGHEENIGYADSFSDGINNRNTLAYPTSVTDADDFTATSQYNFDFGLITRSQTPPPAGHAVGPIRKFTYDSKTRLEKVAIELNGNADYSHTRFVYPDSQNRVDTYSTIEAGQGEAPAFSLLDGHGRSFAAASAHPGSTGGYAAKLMLFDKLGRTIKESNPTETNASGSYLQWPTTGDDNPANGGAGWVYTSQTYDWNSRPLTMTNTDGTTNSASYDGCGCAGGDSVTLTNEETLADGTTKRRQQKIYRDVLGRMTKTETYNWDGAGPNGTNGTVYSTTVNSYNARDQVTRTRKFQGAAPADPNAGSCLSESLRIGTDDSWKHSLNAGAGWQNPGFDDSSWSDSVDEGPHNTSPWGFGGFQPDTPAHWIWHYDSRFSGDNATVYFRKGFIATSNAATLTIRADNVYTAYLNGVQVATGNQWQSTNVVNLALTPGTTYVLAVEVVNSGGPGGLIAEVSSLGTSCEQGLMSYDGYGRLKTRHVPGQDLSAVTTYNYDDDNSLTSIVDGREATTTFSYANNNRHLVTGITYDVPFGSGIADPSNVTYGYDAAGNRTSMTDGLGSMSYQYDQLSRVSSETRSFADPNSPFLSASYALNYEYNLANQPKKITDHTNSTIAYNYDQAGKLLAVTGENNLYAGVSTYAAAATYRAWGALKGVTYGNNYTTALKYNQRLQGTEFEVSGRPAQLGPSTVIKSQFSYYSDATLKFAHDTLDERFDRAYSYDNAGRLKEAYTGSEARDYRDGTNSGTQTGPYRQSYQYDVYDHITQRSNRFWSQFDSFNASYANNRRQDPAFQYDADGHLKKDLDLNYTYDAAGRSVTTSDNLGFNGQTTTLSYNGDGLALKQSVTQSGQTTVTYYVRSSALGGRVVTELNGQGIKQKGYVFVGTQVIARQENNAVVWQHLNPLTGTSGDSFANGNYVITNEPDSMGVNVGTEDPFSGLIMEGFTPSPVMPMMFNLFDDPSGCGSNPNCTRCYLDGFEIGCGRAAELLDRGVAQFDTIATVRVTFESGRTQTFVDRTTLPPGMDVRFTGGLAQAAWLGFRLGNIWGGFDTGVHWALNNAVAAQQNAGGENIGRIIGGFASFFVAPQGATGQQSPQNPGAQRDNRTICDRMAADAQRIAGETRDDYPRATAAWALQEFNRRFGEFTFGSYFAEGPLGFLGTPASSRNNVLGTRPYQGASGFPTQFLDSIDPTEDAVHHFGAYFSAGLAGHKLAPDWHRADDRESNNMGDVRLADQSRRLGESLRAHPNQLTNIGELIRRIICNGGEVPR